MNQLELLKTITELSHEFGTSSYVLGGGGNTSAKNETTLWVKPSGTTLGGLKPELFVQIDRQKLSSLYSIEAPADASERETLVKDQMAAAVSPQTPGRASVEAPLHDSLEARFVVHTHPAVVNGLTCAKNGKQMCQELFPDALWLDYIDPGYTLCMHVRQEIKNYKEANGSEPSLIFLKNHGIFVAANTADQIRDLYEDVISVLTGCYNAANIDMEVDVNSSVSGSVLDSEKSELLEALDGEELFIAADGMFDYAKGAITPDHIVYAKSFPYVGGFTKDGIASYKAQYGYMPHIYVSENAVYAVGATEKKADLALQLALDGSLVIKLAEAFGGIDFMTDSSRLFIENWEVESYRSKQV